MRIQNARILTTIVSVLLHTLTLSAHIQIKHTLSHEAKEYLLAHNVFRQKMNVPPLQWDEKLAHFARVWALTRINDCNHHHHSKGPYGENIFWELYDEKEPNDIVKIWFDEQKNYDHQRFVCKCPHEDDKCMCGHYTQLIWYNSQRVGCGNVTCNGEKGTYIVCSYDPPGNYPGKSPFGKAVNVQSPPSGSPPPLPSSVNPSPPPSNPLPVPSPPSVPTPSKTAPRKFPNATPSTTPTRPKRPLPPRRKPLPSTTPTQPNRPLPSTTPTPRRKPLPSKTPTQPNRNLPSTTPTPTPRRKPLPSTTPTLPNRPLPSTPARHRRHRAFRPRGHLTPFRHRKRRAPRSVRTPRGCV